jgi:hypothetical protein
MKLTATTVKTAELPAGKTEAIFFDDDIPGFGLRLREGGSSRTWNNSWLIRTTGDR